MTILDCKRTKKTEVCFYIYICLHLSLSCMPVAGISFRNMVGTEYTLLHAQEPILYVIRKQLRHSPTHGMYVS